MNSNVMCDYDYTQEKWQLEDLDEGELLFKRLPSDLIDLMT